ncbi:MAG: S-layer homology domain-containing protein, partial [Clostridiales bacterium]|nr:S-layer homology domain-containing protein [Clostridiales bacterium]
MKRVFAVLLCAALLAAAVPAALAAPALSFPDITDTELKRDVAVLTMLGVIDGDENGRFNPNKSLTRAQFCKMAIILLGRGAEEPMYRNRTIFPDVTSTHWARGYINMAVTGEKKFIIGNADRTFRPDDDVTNAQAVTMVMRILGYTDADAGMLWPDGYMSLAREKGLLEGLDLSDVHAPMTRAQAARLLCNMLAAQQKGGGSFLSTLGSVVDGVVVMNITGTADDSVIKTSAGDFKPAGRGMSREMIGLRGALLRDLSGRVLTFLPDRTGQVTAVAAEADASWLKTVDGARYTISPTAPAYTADEVTVYGTAFVNIAAGMSVTLYFSRSGAVEALYISTGASDKAVVAGASVTASSLLELTGGVTDYAVYKNGVKISLSDIAQYDVLTYDAAGKVLRVTDFRLTGAIESCWPNLSSPAVVTVLGKEFRVLPSAMGAFRDKKIGQIVTLLLTSDFAVAGVVAGGTLENTAVGVVTSVSGSHATVRLLNGLELTGEINAAGFHAGDFVSVYSSAAGQMTLVRLTGSNVTGTLNLETGRLGTAPLSPAVRVYERAGKGAAVQIRLSDIALKTVPASRVLFAAKDSKGAVTLLLLDDVTGDRYTYGMLQSGSQELPIFGDEPVDKEGKPIPHKNTTVTVVNSRGSVGPAITGASFATGDFGGVVVPAVPNESARVVVLTKLGT